MENLLTIRLDKGLNTLLKKASRVSKRKRSDIARDALRRQLSIILFNQLRAESVPYAEKKGYLTDDDVFRDIS